MEYFYIMSFPLFEQMSVASILLSNFISYLDWAFTVNGGYVVANQSNIQNLDKTILKLHDDKAHTLGRVWQSDRKNWVWEPNIGPDMKLFVNGSEVTSGYKIKPYHGQIVFNEPLPQPSLVKMSHAFKIVDITPEKRVPWVRNIQLGSSQNNKDVSFSSDGQYAQLGATRIQLPTVLVDVPPVKTQDPYQLGGGKELYHEVKFTVIAESESRCTSIVEQIALQQETTIKLYNPITAAESGHIHTDLNGYLLSGDLTNATYPEKIKNNYYRLCFIDKAKTFDVSELTPTLYIGTVHLITAVRH